MRLELGSGDRPTPGWTTLDIRDTGADIVDDATTLGKVPDESCDAIRAAHLLEHFGRHQTIPILILWRSKLKPGGTLDLEVPNLTGHVQDWRASLSTDERFIEALFGEQDHEHNIHRTMFTASTLQDALIQAGFQATSVQDIGLVLLVTARR